jgi:photosystem II stability/assembly factor-like uncharacterized protein
VYDWTLLQPDTQLNFLDVFFIDEQIGWIVGEDNTILSTTSGGKTWPQAPVNSLDGNFRSAFLISDTEGWLAGDMKGNNMDGNIYYSSNGGAYPEIQKSLEYPMNTIFSLDKYHVWSGGENGQILYTIDGGAHWNESSTPLEITIFDIQFLNPDIGYACGSEGNIIRSTDGGITWQNEFKIPDVDIMALHFINSEKGWACGTGNTILRFEANGSHSEWSDTTIINEPAGTAWQDIFFIDDHIGWIIGDLGAVYRSENAGKSWEKELTDTFSDLNAIYMMGYKKGWIVGDEGVILTYTP